MDELEKPVVITEPKNHSNSKSTETVGTPQPETNGNKSYVPPKKSKKSNKWLIGLAAIIVVGGAAGYGGAWLEEELDSTNTSVLKTSKEDGNATVTANEESISSVARTVSPSVVSILTTSQQAATYYNQGYEQDGAGTGMIVTSDGYIMTNNHVIDGADTVTVVLPNGDTYENVQVVGSDPLNDVAFLKIKDVKDLPAVVFGDSKTVRIGQSVVAIGNALGQYQNTVTSGIISGTGRPVTASSEGAAGSTETLTDLIQTDAAINPGNSGGPLLNFKGQVIGINTAVASDAQGIGFSIPIGATKGLLNHLVKTGKIERAYLGVQYVSITPEVKEQYKLPVNKGDYITATKGNSVQLGGPADKAGIKDGDIIVAVNGYEVGKVASVASLISENEPGDTVEVTVLRDSKERTFKVTLGTYQG